MAGILQINLSLNYTDSDLLSIVKSLSLTDNTADDFYVAGNGSATTSSAAVDKGGLTNITYILFRTAPATTESLLLSADNTNFPIQTKEAGGITATDMASTTNIYAKSTAGTVEYEYVLIGT